jgi:hypothetical protein
MLVAFETLPFPDEHAIYAYRALSHGTHELPAPSQRPQTPNGNRLVV